jgi:DNA-binding SARP family transcriptional activator
VKKSAPESGCQPEDNPKLLTICELIDAGQYDQVANQLNLVQKTNHQDGDQFPPEILEAVYQISLACQEFKNEKAQHQRAFQEASQREQALQTQLREIINLIKQDTTSKNGAKDQTKHAVETKKTDSPKPAKLSRFWQHIQNILGLKNFQRPASEELPLVLEDETLHQDSVEYISTIDPSFTKEADISDDFDEGLEYQSHPSLVVYCLGPFRVYQNDQLINEWPSSKGKSIFKYMIAHRKQSVPKEVLMELFWPDTQPDAARNNLNVSIYGLRQALRSINPNYSHILFQDESYSLNPEMNIWIDFEEFSKCLQTGRQKEKQGQTVSAIQAFRAAEVLYQGEFLSEDRYEDWIISLRRSLQDDLQKMLGSLCLYYQEQGDLPACVTVNNKMLTIDPCCEEAHRRLIRCYYRQGQPYLALRQYHLCKDALREDLGLSPSKETQLLFQQIQKGKLR